MESNSNTLIVLLGPTGVGKTALSLDIARHYGSSIISADSRQIYKELPIGTAAATIDMQLAVPHFFVGSHSITEYYGAKSYEYDVLSILPCLFQKNAIQIMCGGSMMYIDAVCNGIDDIPDVNPKIREVVYRRYEEEGLQNILVELQSLDPVYYDRVDKNNYKRVLHGYEICLSTSKPYSSFLTGEQQKRSFRIIKLGLQIDRAHLYQRINLRVDQMIQNGLVDEAYKVYAQRHLNALNTVGYKELFACFDGKWSLKEAIDKIKKNTRVYARKQITWWKRDSAISWFTPQQYNEIITHIDNVLYSKE